MLNLKSLQKVIYFIDKSFYKKIYVFLFLIFFSMFLEMISLSLIFPVVSLIIDKNSLNQYPALIYIFESFSFLKFLNKDQQFDIIIGALFLFFFTIVIKNVLIFLINAYRAHFIFELQYNLRNKFLMQLSSLSFKKTLHLGNADFITYSGQIGGIVGLIENALIILTETLILLSIVFFLVIFGEQLVIILASIIIIFSFIILKFQKKKLICYGEQRRLAERNQFFYLQNIINGIKEIKLTASWNFFFEFFKLHSKKALESDKYFKIFSLFPRAYLETIMILIIVIFMTISLINETNYSNVISIGAIFLASGVRMVPSITKIMAGLNMFKYYKPILYKLYYTSIDLKKFDEGVAENIKFTKNIQIQNVSFSYNSKKIISDLSLSVNIGDLVGIFGDSGSGKSTIINILTGLLTPQSGNILIDGKKINKNYIISNLSIVTQSPFFVNDSIINNLCFGKKIEQMSFIKIERILKIVELSDVIKKLDSKLNAIIGESGNLLSGGQLQRLGIARALYRDSEILILDEATNALDINSQDRIIKNIFENYKNKLIIIISHDLDVINKCKTIYKMDKNKLKLIKK